MNYNVHMTYANNKRYATSVIAIDIFDALAKAEKQREDIERKRNGVPCVPVMVVIKARP